MKNIQHTLAELRAKPEHIRRRIATWTTVGISAVIFTFWLGSFSLTAGPVKGSVETAVDKAGSPASALIAGVGDFGRDVWELVFGPKKVTYSGIEVYPTER